ncbi:MAG: hypothetical protein HUU21_07825 [Polyangiaceae bacterium]|nr:hypothetical protein [Polyangiaceae bacterium]NUQ73448.1 hypothetical protein [Polyangiaceae bacterium]
MKSLRGSHFAARITIAMVCAAVAGPARAQEASEAGRPEAVKLFESAKAHLNSEQYDIACPMFLQSYTMDTTKIGVLFALAECYARAGDAARAVPRYEEYLRAVDALPPDKRENHRDRARHAEAQLKALAGDAPEVTFALPAPAPQPAPPKTAPAPVSHPLPVNRGAPDESAAGGWRISSYIAFGVGGAGVALGTIMGGLALSRRDAVMRGCPAAPSNGSIRCATQADADFANRTAVFGAVSTASFSVAAVGLAAGLGLLIFAPDERARAAHQSSIRVAVESAGAGDAMVSIKGSF